MANQSDELSQVRKNIEKSMEIADRERKQKLQTQRLEFARVGIESFKMRNLGEAVKAFQNYLKTLEELKDVPEGKLSPSNFDIKKDHQELLMISGIYWDLVKLYDRTKSKNKKKEFLHYLEKYVEFSKGMPFQPLCAESLRKYLSSDKPIHRGDFSSAYRTLSVSKCFVATALIDVIGPETLPRLRVFRDEVLDRSALGKKWIAWYYRWGPICADRIQYFPAPVRKVLGRILDRIAEKLFKCHYPN